MYFRRLLGWPELLAHSNLNSMFADSQLREAYYYRPFRPYLMHRRNVRTDLEGLRSCVSL
jgi:hypothetical protein